jgi:hypothetical protein
MNRTHATRLGELKPVGKQALFRFPIENEEEGCASGTSKVAGQVVRKRVRTTIELSTRALVIIQELQSRLHPQTGKVLPLWKLTSQAIECLPQPA